MLAQVLCGVASGEGLTWRCNVKKELRTEENLHAASYHLLYEMWMLQEIVRELSQTGNHTATVRNALSEAFLVHARVLIHFLYSENPRRDDITAEDFIESAKWREERGGKSPAVEDAKHRADKRLAHLTTVRMDARGHDSPMQIGPVFHKIDQGLRAFVRLAPRACLDQCWHEWVGGAQTLDARPTEGLGGPHWSSIAIATIMHPGASLDTASWSLANLDAPVVHLGSGRTHDSPPSSTRD